MLILSSCDFRNNRSKDVIVNSLSQPLQTCCVLFIPNEKATTESIRSGKYHYRLREFGFDPHSVYVFDDTRPEAFTSLDLDIIYISGGNTFHTMQKIRRSGFDTAIVRYVNDGVIYIGGSAGAHIASQDISHVAAFDDVPDDMTDFNGLGLWDGILICHYTEERKPMYKQLQAQGMHNVYVLADDESYIVI